MKEELLVVGGGIVGLSCAYEAAKRGGRKVTIVDRGDFGGQASGAAAGMLAPYTENSEQPDPFFRLCLDSLRLYPEWAEEIERLSGISVELTHTGSIQVALHEADMLPLRTRQRWQNEWGARAEWLDAADLRRLEPGLSSAAAGGLYCPEESHVYAPKLVKALEAACRRLGVCCAGNAGDTVDLMLDGGRVRLVTETGGRFEADRAIVCAGAWTGAFERWFGFAVPVNPIRGQICAYHSPIGEVRQMVFTSQAYWVGKRNGTLVCGASEDIAGFDTSVTERGIARLTRWSGRVFPALADRSPVHRWAGLRPATLDGWPLLGPVPGAPQAVVAAGHYRNGILLAPVTAKRICDVLDGTLPAAELAPFAPDRFAASARTLG